MVALADASGFYGSVETTRVRLQDAGGCFTIMSIDHRRKSRKKGKNCPADGFRNFRNVVAPAVGAGKGT